MKHIVALAFALLLMNTSAWAYKDPSPLTNLSGFISCNGNGTCTGSTLGNTLTNVGSVLNTIDVVNPLSTSTSYTVLSSDMGKTLTSNSTNAVAVTLPQAGTTGFQTGVSFTYVNIGIGNVVITPMTSTINSNASITITTGEGAYLISDGSNWVAFQTLSAPAVNYYNVTYANLGLGQNALAVATGTYNVALGANIMPILSTGTQNIGLGGSSSTGNNATMQKLTTGSNNVGLGFATLYNEVSGSDNVAVGRGSQYNATSSQNTSIGSQSCNALTSSTGDVCIGYQAGLTFTGSNETLIGFDAGQIISSGSNNTVIGSGVASTVLTTGSNNILVGTSSSVTTPTGSTSYDLNIGQAIISDMHVPTVSSGFGTSPSITHGTANTVFTVNVGTGGTASSGVIAFTNPAPNGWACDVTDSTTTSSSVFVTKSVPTSTTTVTFTNYNTSGAATAWAASDVLVAKCLGY